MNPLRAVRAAQAQLWDSQVPLPAGRKGECNTEGNLSTEQLQVFLSRQPRARERICADLRQLCSLTCPNRGLILCPPHPGELQALIPHLVENLHLQQVDFYILPAEILRAAGMGDQTPGI